jgi:hypothetical protein
VSISAGQTATGNAVGNVTAGVLDLIRGNVVISGAGGNVSIRQPEAGIGNVALGTGDQGAGADRITELGEGGGVGGGRGEGTGIGIGPGTGSGTGTGVGSGLGAGSGAGQGQGAGGVSSGGLALTPIPSPTPSRTFDLNVLDLIRQQALTQEGGQPIVRTGGGGLITSEEADLSALFGGKPEELQDVWNQASLRLRNALGI